MNVEAAEELRLCWHAASLEAVAVTPGERAFNSEALQRALWRHREALLQLVLEEPAREQRAAAYRAALQPFARAAAVLPAGQNPVLISLPAPDDGRTFVQLRPADFRRAAALLGDRA